MIGQAVLTQLQHHLPPPLDPLAVPALECVEGEEASSPATYPSTLPSPSPPCARPPDLLSPSEGASKPAGGDQKGCTIEPCSETKWTMTLRIKSRGKHPPLTNHPLRCRFGRKEGGVDGDDSELESLAGLEEDPSPDPLIPTRDKTKGIGRRALKKRLVEREF